ncbi:MAG: ammonium transporter, partial [Polyangiaceae bacterium]
MSSLLTLHRYRQWFAVLCLAVVALVAAPRSASADEPTPDPIGAFQTTPTALSIGGYTKPDPDKATTKELATAIDAVAQSSSRSYFSINFMWVLIAGFLVIFMQAGFALVETGLIRAKNASH